MAIRIHHKCFTSYRLGNCLFNRDNILFRHHIRSLLLQNCIWRADAINVGWRMRTGYRLSRRGALNRTMYPEILARISVTPDSELSQACLMENIDELYITYISRGNLSYSVWKRNQSEHLFQITRSSDSAKVINPKQNIGYIPSSHWYWTS